jgi:hypothetical protein
MDNLGPTPQEAKATEEALEKTINFFTSKRGILLIIITVLTAILFIYVIGSGINDWIQCIDGSNFSSEVVDGETLYIDKCDAY